MANNKQDSAGRTRGGRANFASLVASVGEHSPVDGIVDGQFYANVPLDQLVGNPRNRKVGDVSDLASIVEKQLQPATAITASRWLAAFPEDVEVVGRSKYVIIAGNRRLAAAHEFGRNGLDILVRDSLAKTRADLVRTAIVENIDRRNFNPIEEAEAIEQLIAEVGTASKAAEQLKRTEGFVSQRRALLKLIEPLRDEVRAGTLAVRDARSIASLPPGEQADARAQFRTEEDSAGEGGGEQSPSKQGERGKSKRGAREATPESVAKTVRRLAAPPAILAAGLAETLDASELKELATTLSKLARARK
ncbi:peptide transporter [Tsukamurella conjunctivitidis]|uniref:Peptide transporter n=1 Tax=Tsukamurella conjunctivitidis TaxID=2592068 RepID=A0A5C5RPG1_9ACTN|nr:MULTISPECIES: ParB/RepB/Spo0J family partition protein [Tsukamurella]RDB48309.1 peptide transporter [Tsukamurella tyrosinosolvens]TWS24570.1 peptide transporter [Tsukamurella conjunctivitidis]